MSPGAAWVTVRRATANLLDGDFQVAHDLAKRMLQHWHVDPDLAGLRDPGALDALSPDERKECLALWNQVAAGLIHAQANK